MIVSSEANAFLGIGYSPDGSGSMADNTAVIGTISGNEALFAPALKYSLQTVNLRGATMLGMGNQTLLNNYYISMPLKGTQMNFTKLLSDGLEIIDPEGDATFIWAVGNDYTLNGHAAKGSIVLPLNPCVSSNSKWKSEKAKYKRAVYLHASLAVIAFGFLVPLAVIASSFRRNACFNREICGTKIWIIVHASSNLISFLVAS